MRTGGWLPSLNRDGDGEDASTGRGPVTAMNEGKERGEHGHWQKRQEFEGKVFHSVFMDSTDSEDFNRVINGKT